MINYKQLYYFWNVAKFDGVTRAAQELRLTPQTISGQVNELARSLEVELFERSGRRLKLSQTGRLVFAHAEEIFNIGKELEAIIKGRQQQGELLFRVGVSDVIPKSLAYRLLAPAMQIAEPVRLLSYANKLDQLFAELAIHEIDLVIADRPLPAELGVKGFSHSLGESAVAFYGTPALARQIRDNFPHSLNGAPMLLPGVENAMRPALERWFAQLNIQPQVKGEFDDSALMKAFGQEGIGLFPAPAVVQAQATRQHGVEIAGTAWEVTCHYYAISAERKLRHPAVLAISQAAQDELFAEPKPGKRVR
jgi:LysR family transcriptional activator of nhaA